MARKQKAILIGISLLMIFILISAAALYTQRKNPIIGEFTEPEFDIHAVAGIPAIPDEALKYETLNLSRDLTVSLCVNLIANKEDDKVDVYFTSDIENFAWIRIVLLNDEEEQLGSSGLLRPGEYVKSIALKKKLPQKSGVITAKVLSYEPNTYHSMGSAFAKIYLNIN